MKNGGRLCIFVDRYGDDNCLQDGGKVNGFERWIFFSVWFFFLSLGRLECFW